MADLQPTNIQFQILYRYINDHKMNRNDGYRLTFRPEQIIDSKHLEIKIGITRHVRGNDTWQTLIKIEKFGNNDDRIVFRIMDEHGVEDMAARYVDSEENEADKEKRWAQFQAAMLTRFELEYNVYIQNTHDNNAQNISPPMSPGPMHSNDFHSPSSGPAQMWMCLDKLCNLLVKIG